MYWRNAHCNCARAFNLLALAQRAAGPAQRTV
ncbi:hypothetical protein A2U01_0089685 [Trifolium medium]|uniref:Uncharacterized protein n=1 Tax=Trifolium medium TaxID=97028 RepID=A0A392U6M1_9FABA|nr:hypothetical protein [Trifolium medium]